MMKKKLWRTLRVLTAIMATGAILLTGCGKKGEGETASGAEAKAEENTGGAEAEAKEAGDNPTVTMMIDIPGFAPINNMMAMIEEKFPEYNIISKNWPVTTSDMKKTITTTFQSGGSESVDISFMASRVIQSYVDADMLLDLTPYLDADPEWKASIPDNLFDAATIDGKIYAIPWQAAYPVLVINNDIAEEVGVELSENMSYDEWMSACQKFLDAGYATFGMQGDNDWILHQAYLNAFETEEDFQKFANGEIPFTDERVKAAFDKMAFIYNSNYCYLGEGALAATKDEVVAGFANKKVVCVIEANGGVSTLLENTGIENYSVICIPSFSNTGMHQVLGAPDCFFVPANAKNVEATIAVLKYLTSDDVMQATADAGMAVANQNVSGSSELYAEITKDKDKMQPDDPVKLSEEINSYLQETAVSEYLYLGDAALEKVDEMLEKLK